MKQIFFTSILGRNSVQRGVFFSFYVIILSSCVNQQQYLNQPVPGYTDVVVHDISLLIGDITETKAGAGNENIPEWLIAFFNGGVEEVEQMEFFMNRYCFIISIEGANFGALNKWADNFSASQDFSRQAAVRMERRLISAATTYPDDEYGDFYELLVKKAFDAEYPDAFLEDTFWIKRSVSQNEPDTDEANNSPEVYEFFVFISIDKSIMQSTIVNMMAEVLSGVTVTRTQNNAIRRLQQIFFVGF